MVTASPESLSEPATRLLKAAEQLFAEKGFAAVSIREINRAAGSKNHTAVQYHFGGLDQLVQAILDYRMLPLNQQRCVLLDQLKQEGQTANIRKLVGVMVEPFCHQLAEPLEDSHYISLLNQLFIQPDGLDIFLHNPARSSALMEVTEMLGNLLTHLQDDVLFDRLQMAGSQVITTVGFWQNKRMLGQLDITPEKLTCMNNNLCDFICAGLSAGMEEQP
jgi:AcrR family transcriptional regulator